MNFSAIFIQNLIGVRLWKLFSSAILFLLLLWCRLGSAWLGCLQNLVPADLAGTKDLGRFGQSKQMKLKAQNLRHLNSIQISRKKFSMEFIQNCDGNLNFYQKSQNIYENITFKEYGKIT